MITQRDGYKINDRRGEAKGGAVRGPKSSWGFYPTPRYAGWDNYRPRPFMAQTAGKGGLAPFDRWEIMNYGKQLFSQLGHVAAAVIQKNSWAVGDGWDPVFEGTNEAWGEEVAAWGKEIWYPNCNVRGEQFDFKTSLYLSGLGWDVDGDDLMILTETGSGFPQISVVPCQRIGGVARTDTMVQGGQFSGAKLYDGVIYDRNGRPVGFRVMDDELAENSELAGQMANSGGTGDGYRDVPAYACQFMFEPEWSDQGRGISKFGRPILDLMDVQDIDVFLKRGVKLDSSQGLTIYTESGEGEDIDTTITNSSMLIGGTPSGDTRTDEIIPTRGYQMVPIAGGEYRYMKANSGEKVEPMASERPHPNTEAFIERLERRIMVALQWSYDLLDLTAISGAPSRLLKDLAMRAINDKQKYLKRRALRAWRYAVCKGMKTGRIPKYYGNYGDGDFLKWGFEMPGEISIDTGNDEAADRENLKIGTTTLQNICAKKGMGFWKNMQAQSRKEILGWVAEAKIIEAESGGLVTFEKAMELLTQRTPNGTPMAEMGDLPGDGEPGSKEGKAKVSNKPAPVPAKRRQR